MQRETLERISIRMGDITHIEVDAVVNAANPTLQGGAGVDGMIHWAAGSGLLEECLKIGGCPTGEARITGGYNLPSRYIIHTVGPVYGIDREEAPRLLSSCYSNSLNLAVRHGIHSIAFPAISCGTYGYPAEEACRIALDTTLEFLENDDSIRKVIFVLYSCKLYDIYSAYLQEIRDRISGT
jgi:O-acetyl-ADP-ribose deacetylase (regulator of RNase III)